MYNRFDRYIKSKMRIVQNQANDDIFIYNGDDSNIPIGYVQMKPEYSDFPLIRKLVMDVF